MMVPPSGAALLFRDCDRDIMRHFDRPKSAICEEKEWVTESQDFLFKQIQESIIFVYVYSV